MFKGDGAHFVHLDDLTSERGLHSSKGITGNDCSQPYNVGRKSCRGGPSTFANFFPNLVNFPPLIPILFLSFLLPISPSFGNPLVLT